MELRERLAAILRAADEPMGIVLLRESLRQEGVLATREDVQAALDELVSWGLVEDACDGYAAAVLLPLMPAAAA
jgi:hypothetical protein